jgi:hypothetical protein
MTAELAVVERPNGKVYRARKAPGVFLIDNPHLGETEVMVIRTHDADRATALAATEARRCGIEWEEPVPATISWARESIRDGEPWWEFDDVRGVPCVVFSPGRFE